MKVGGAPGGCLQSGDVPLQGVQTLCLLGTDQALNLQSQAVNISADLEGGRLVGLNISQSEDSKYITLTNQRAVSSPGQCWPGSRMSEAC